MSKAGGWYIIAEQKFGAWRSPVARTVRVGEDGGSNPLAPTKYRKRHQPFFVFKFGNRSLKRRKTMFFSQTIGFADCHPPRPDR